MTAVAAVVVAVMFLAGSTVILSTMGDQHDQRTTALARRTSPVSGYTVGFAMLLVAVVGTVMSR